MIVTGLGPLRGLRLRYEFSKLEFGENEDLLFMFYPLAAYNVLMKHSL